MLEITSYSLFGLQMLLAIKYFCKYIIPLCYFHKGETVRWMCSSKWIECLSKVSVTIWKNVLSRIDSKQKSTYLYLKTQTHLQAKWRYYYFRSPGWIWRKCNLRLELTFQQVDLARSKLNHGIFVKWHVRMTSLKSKEGLIETKRVDCLAHFFLISTTRATEGANSTKLAWESFVLSALLGGRLARLRRDVGVCRCLWVAAPWTAILPLDLKDVCGFCVSPATPEKMGAGGGHTGL